MFENIDLNKLFDTESDYAKGYIYGTPTEEMIARAEKSIGYTFPKSYIELLKFQNGGVMSNNLSDECWITAIYGIGETESAFNGIEEMFINWIEEWEYPNIGIPFGETQSAGHDMYFMDMREVDANGEPAIVRIENEGDPEDANIIKIADNLEEFLKMIINGDEI